MNRKIIIKAEDLNGEIHSFLTEVGADMPINWSTNAVGLIRDAVIEAYKRMGIQLEVDERRQVFHSLSSKETSKKKGQGQPPIGSLPCSRRERRSAGRRVGG